MRSNGKAHSSMDLVARAVGLATEGTYSSERQLSSTSWTAAPRRTPNTNIAKNAMASSFQKSSRARIG